MTWSLCGFCSSFRGALLRTDPSLRRGTENASRAVNIARGPRMGPSRTTPQLRPRTTPRSGPGMAPAEGERYRPCRDRRRAPAAHYDRRSGINPPSPTLCGADRCISLSAPFLGTPPSGWSRATTGRDRGSVLGGDRSAAHSSLYRGAGRRGRPETLCQLGLATPRELGRP